MGSKRLTYLPSSVLATPANAPDGFCQLGILRRHRLIWCRLGGLLGFQGLLPGGPCRFLALIARLALGPRLDETALLCCSLCRRQTRYGQRNRNAGRKLHVISDLCPIPRVRKCNASRCAFLPVSASVLVP